MAAGALLAAGFVLLALAAPLVLWALVESETENTRVMDRARAEREAGERYRERSDRSVDPEREKRR